MTHVTCRLTAKNRDQLRNPTLGNRLWATFFLLIRPRRSHRAQRCGILLQTTHVPWSVSEFVSPLSFAKTAEPIASRFGSRLVWSQGAVYPMGAETPPPHSRGKGHHIRLVETIDSSSLGANTRRHQFLATAASRSSNAAF